MITFEYPICSYFDKFLYFIYNRGLYKSRFLRILKRLYKKIIGKYISICASDAF